MVDCLPRIMAITTTTNRPTKPMRNLGRFWPMTKMPMPKNRAKATISKGRVVKRFTGLALAEALDASDLALVQSWMAASAAVFRLASL